MASQNQSSTSHVASKSKGLTARSSKRMTQKASRREEATLEFSQYKVKALACSSSLQGAQPTTGRKFLLPRQGFIALTCDHAATRAAPLVLPVVSALRSASVLLLRSNARHGPGSSGSSVAKLLTSRSDAPRPELSKLPSSGFPPGCVS
eukprot:5571889-Amphidinium_carterae.2